MFEQPLPAQAFGFPRTRSPDPKTHPARNRHGEAEGLSERTDRSLPSSYRKVATLTCQENASGGTGRSPRGIRFRRRRRIQVSGIRGQLSGPNPSHLVPDTWELAGGLRQNTVQVAPGTCQSHDPSVCLSMGLLFQRSGCSGRDSRRATRGGPSRVLIRPVRVETWTFRTGRGAWKPHAAGPGRGTKRPERLEPEQIECRTPMTHSRDTPLTLTTSNLSVRPPRSPLALTGQRHSPGRTEAWCPSFPIRGRACCRNSRSPGRSCKSP